MVLFGVDAIMHGNTAQGMLADVAVEGVDKPLTYIVPADLASSLCEGSWVSVPMRRRFVEGVVVRLRAAEEAHPAGLLSVRHVAQVPPVPPDLLALAKFIAEYYLVSVGDAHRLLRLTRPAPPTWAWQWQTAAAETEASGVDPLQALLLSPAERALQGWFESKKDRWVTQRQVTLQWNKAGGHTADRSCAAVLETWLHRGWVQRQVASPPKNGRSTRKQAADEPATEKKQLNEDQQKALQRLSEALHATEPTAQRAFLLHGVTGAGKTELYLQLIDQALRLGRTAVVLVPEIALTPQLAGRFRARFGDLVGVLHSGVGEAERKRCWQAFGAGTMRIAVGARSALFAQLPNLGVVVVDEEHDPSFKQQEGVYYHARDLALVRARLTGSVVVLGTATPSCEAWHLATVGKLALLRLPQRAREQQALPRVDIVDLRQHVGIPRQGMMAAPLRQAIADTLAAGEQALIFLNRRGYAGMVLCTGCGHRIDCKSCSVTLVWHRQDRTMVCHYCGHTQPWDEHCPQCRTAQLSLVGFGTEKIVDELQAQFPEARIARLDRDVATPASMERILQSVHDRSVDILVGTQMVAKGHDFPHVTLVGIVWADVGMHWPDFRATERTFQVLTQVAGRAGRGDRPGRVVLQTWTPEHPAIQFAQQHDTVSFVQQELAARARHGFPPFRRMAALRLDGEDASKTRVAAEQIADLLRDKIQQRRCTADADLLGPAAAPLSRLKGRTRQQLFVRATSSRLLHALLADVAVQFRALKIKGVRLKMDIDPSTMM